MFHILRSNRLATLGLVMVCVFVLFATLAPWLAPQDPAHIDLPARLARPSLSHWMGTDELGRDVLSRVIYGARISIMVGTCAVAPSLLLGLIFRRHARYYGRRIDRRFNRVHKKRLLF